MKCRSPVLHLMSRVDSKNDSLYFVHTMKTVKEIQSVLAHHKPDLRRRYGVREIAIFGSIARGEATSTSDVDLLVEFERPIGLDFVALADYLEQILGTPVDLATRNSLKPSLRSIIERELVYA